MVFIELVGVILLIVGIFIYKLKRDSKLVEVRQKKTQYEVVQQDSIE